MDLIYKLLFWLGSYVEKPPMYGTYHLMWVFGLIIACVVFAIFSKNKTDKFFKNTLLICWIVLVVLEIVKEIMVGFSIDGNNIAHYKYDFMYFPYQLCSLPFYFLPFIIFLKNEKIKAYFLSATISFIMLGGLMLVLIPGGFKNVLYLNFHTMIHHCLQVFTSFVCILWYKDEMSFKNFFKCIIPLIICMILSIVLNSLIYKVKGISVQLWNLSPYVVFDLEILENIRIAIGYIPYVIVYFILVICLSLILYMIPVLIKKLKRN